ncbi:MAG: zf-HC2 domain-containing protein [Deltaproteobacteria bacterium]|nr:zf-HC2 domain-containing protein [Deltaproteobacteria bacterium]
MDCEKAEPLLIDELYDELDEVTSAAVKRHVSGCARCSSILSGMRSTRKLAALPLVPLPAGLEDRILTSIKEAQKVSGYPNVARAQSRTARILSLAGNWAMRPQTAMAAVFLLMIGTSAFVLRSRRAESPQAVSVTEQGAPAAAPTSADPQDSLDSKAAAAAHGPNAPVAITTPPAATATAAASASNGQAFARNDPNGAAGLVDGITGGKGRAGKDDQEGQSALGSSLQLQEESQARDKDEAKKTANAPPPAANRRDYSNAGPPAGAPYANGDDYAPRAQTAAPTTAKEKAAEANDGFSAGMVAYKARRFADATKEFDAAARTGDQNAALWAAKSVKEGNGGCNPAITRFDAVAQKAGDSWLGHEAQLEAARCQIALGRLDEARTRLAKLQSVASHASQAQQALNELNQVAQRREAERTRAGGGTAGGAAGAARAAPSPAKAPAPKATAIDSASGY